MERIQIAREPVAFVARGRKVLEVPSAGPHVRLGLRAEDALAGDFWETLSYLALWLCGWTAIGLGLF